MLDLQNGNHIVTTASVMSIYVCIELTDYGRSRISGHCSQVKTASEMTYIVSSGALNSTPTNLNHHT